MESNDPNYGKYQFLPLATLDQWKKATNVALWQECSVCSIQKTITCPRIAEHYNYIPGQLTLFKVRQSRTVMIEVTELDLDPALYDKLIAYKNRMTGCNWDGNAVWWDVLKVLSHRYYNGGRVGKHCERKPPQFRRPVASSKNGKSSSMGITICQERKKILKKSILIL